jgi:MFS family permease
LNKQERHIITTTCYGHFLSHFNMLVFPAVLLPLVEQLSSDIGTVLGLSFWMYLLFGCTALLWGLAADFWGAGILMAVYFMGAGISGLAAAMWLYDPGKLTICLAALGCFSGIYHPAGLGMISKGIKRVSVAMGYNGIFGNLGLASAPFIAGVGTWLWGPRSAYIILSAMNFLGLLLLRIFPLNAAQPGPTDGPSEGNGATGAFIILLVAMMVGGIAYRGATVVTPAYLEMNNQHLFEWLKGLINFEFSRNLVATSITSIIFLVGMMGQFAGGRWAERFDPRTCYLVFIVITIPAALLMAVVDDFGLVVISLIYFFFLLGIQPAENTLVARYTPPQFHHSAFGAKFVLTFGVGSAAVKVVALIEDNAGVEAVLFFLGFASLVWVVTILLLFIRTSEVTSTTTRKAGGR